MLVASSDSWCVNKSEYVDEHEILAPPGHICASSENNVTESSYSCTSVYDSDSVEIPKFGM